MSAALDRAYLSAAITRACNGCERLARELLPGGAGLCLQCDAWLERPKLGASSAARTKREMARKERTKRVAPAPSTMARKITACVDELLRWHLARVRAEQTGGGSYLPICTGSSFVAVAEQLRLGTVGNGNSGTKGVWHGSPPEPEAVPFAFITADQETEARYRSLSIADRCTADAVIEDAEGDRIAPAVVGDRLLELTLSQRIGLRTASTEQRIKWAVKIRVRDRVPALVGMHERGHPMLEALARVWFMVEQAA